MGGISNIFSSATCGLNIFQGQTEHIFQSMENGFINRNGGRFNYNLKNCDFFGEIH